MIDPARLYDQLAAAFKQGRWHEAQALAAQLLPLAPKHAGVCGIAGVTCLELQQLPEAVAHLRRATALDPARADFATLLAKALSASGCADQARVQANRAMALQPGDAQTLDCLGLVYVRSHAQAEAATAFAKAVALAPGVAGHRLNLATALTASGCVDAAEAELEACIRLDASCWHAHLLLAQLRRQTASSNHLERLQALLALHHDNAAASLSLHLAMGRECEDLGRYPEAFMHFAQGKAAGRSLRPYSSRRDEKLFANLIRAFPEGMPVASAGDPGDEPIFVIGMPRSGTTLVERILSSHPDVHAAGELQDFAVALQQQSGRQRPFLLDPDLARRARAIDWPRLGARYRASTLPASAHKAHFVDKMPHNFLHVGFIANALPRARIICLRRNPLDTCLGNFRQLFAHPSIHFDYSFDLLDTGRYFVLFDRLMSHWKRAFPGRIHEVCYETLVGSQEACSRELLGHCGLGWDEACLHFENNPAAVATLSSQQVREPIFQSSIGRWKHYERELSGLRKLLQDADIDATA